MSANISKAPGRFAILATAGLVTGNLIGAGILALPINLGLAGMWPSLVAMVFYGGLMFFSAMILAREASAQRDVNFDYPSLYGRFLGPVGKWIATATNMLILYGLLTAYITGGSKIISSLFGLQEYAGVVLIVFAVLLTCLAALDLKAIQRYNIVLMVLMLGSFVVLLIFGESKAEPARMAYSDWEFLPAALPIIVTAFHFHNIIPTICGNLKWNARAIGIAILAGMIIAFIMNAAWVQVGICCLPLTGENSIFASYANNVPATVPMNIILGSKLFIICATLFSMLAIITSYLANGVGLQSFIRDLLSNTFKVTRRSAVLAVTFAPPIAISIIWPDIFLRAIGVVGGIGIVTLFGILPALVAILKKGNPRWLKGLAVLFLILSAIALTVETTQEFGITNLHPNAGVESWDHHHPVAPEGAAEMRSEAPVPLQPQK